MTVATILGYITDAVSAASGWLTQGANAVSSSPMALTMFAVSFCGVGIGLFKRICRIF